MYRYCCHGVPVTTLMEGFGVEEWTCIHCMCFKHVKWGSSLLDLSDVKCCILNFKLILQVLYVVLAKQKVDIMLTVEANMDIHRVPTISTLSYLPTHKCPRSHTLFICSHIHIPIWAHDIYVLWLQCLHDPTSP